MKMLEGKRIKLRLISKEDMAQILEWRSTQTAYESFFTHPVLNMDIQEAWYEKQLKDSTQLNFIIVHIESGVDIGMIALCDIDHMTKKCEWGRIIVGHPEFLGNEYGHEAIEIILNYAFNYLGMHRICCTAIEDNKLVVNLYKRLGFKEEGVLRDYIYKAGSYKNIVLFSMLISEYREKVRSK